MAEQKLNDFTKAQLDLVKEETLRNLSNICGDELESIIIISASKEGKGPVLFKGGSREQAHMLLAASEKLQELQPGIMESVIEERMIARGVDFLKGLFEGVE